MAVKRQTQFNSRAARGPQPSSQVPYERSPWQLQPGRQERPPTTEPLHQLEAPRPPQLIVQARLASSTHRQPWNRQQSCYQSPRVYFTETPVDDFSHHDGDQYDFYAEEDPHLPDHGVPPHQADLSDSAPGMTDQQNETPTDEFSFPAQLCTVQGNDPQNSSMTCLSCMGLFPSNNSLHRHLRTCKPQAAAEATPSVAANFAGPLIIESAKPQNDFRGYAFRSRRYVTATVGLTSTTKLSSCIDSGCVMTLIVSVLASRLGWGRRP
ncbi:hypothetical protein N7461_004737 [Penicillium sp. DV-2018c]|nr:hypothetical protein N7461_004737 [Penicillium sp. DV-2018c]